MGERGSDEQLVSTDNRVMLETQSMSSCTGSRRGEISRAVIVGRVTTSESSELCLGRHLSNYTAFRTWNFVRPSGPGDSKILICQALQTVTRLPVMQLALEGAWLELALGGDS